MPDDEPAPPRMDSVTDESKPGSIGAAFPVVGAGASAGGLEALSLLLRSSPADARMGFVVMQHLAPDHESSRAMRAGGVRSPDF